MKILWRVLKLAACIFGGIVAASFLFVVAIVFGVHDADQQFKIIEHWIPVTWFFGAVCGGLIVYGSERKRVQRV
jgi:hypothetical protein